MLPDIYFAHPHALLDQAHEAIKKVGAEKFFSSSEEWVKKNREGFAAYFFTLAMKKYTGKDWWVAQYDQAIRAYPDFDLMSFGNDPNEIGFESVELTGVYPHFKTFDEVMKVVDKKLTQYGTSPLKFSLLIYVNHEKSEEWINLLREKITKPDPFISIWTIHLRFQPGGKEVGKAVASKIAPHPGLRIEASADDATVHKRQPLPNYLEEIEVNGIKQVVFKKDSHSEKGQAQG